MSLPIAYLRRTYQCVSNSINMSYFWYMSTISTGLSAYLSKNKNISITSPIRYSNVDLDLDNVRKLEETIQHKILRTILYVNADRKAGLLPYSNKDLEIFSMSSLFRLSP